jgi:hypothetical protein
VVQAAVALGLEDGAKLRVDTTVVETDIHHPTDNTLLWDVVRVVTRLIGHLAEALNMRCIEGFRDRRRSARRRMYEIQRNPRAVQIRLPGFDLDSLVRVGASLDFSNILVHRGRESEKDVVLQ